MLCHYKNCHNQIFLPQLTVPGDLSAFSFLLIFLFLLSEESFFYCTACKVVKARTKQSKSITSPSLMKWSKKEWTYTLRVKWMLRGFKTDSCLGIETSIFLSYDAVIYFPGIWRKVYWSRYISPNSLTTTWHFSSYIKKNKKSYIIDQKNSSKWQC